MTVNGHTLTLKRCRLYNPIRLQIKKTTHNIVIFEKNDIGFLFENDASMLNLIDYEYNVSSTRKPATRNHIFIDIS